MKRTLLLLLFLLLSINLISCKKNKLESFIDEYFEYVLIEHESNKDIYYAYIIGLTNLGKLQTTLFIPEKLGGFSVKQIGYNLTKKEIIGNISSDNLVKIYNNDIVRNIAISNFKNHVSLISFHYINSYTFLINDNLTVYVPTLDILNGYVSSDRFSNRYKEANVIFKIQDYYKNFETRYIDSVYNSKIDYYFDDSYDWYLDNKFTILWNKDKYIDNESIVLYGKLKNEVINNF
jgi:hypothetical protein